MLCNSGRGWGWICRRVLIDTGEPERRDYLELLRSTLKQTKSTISDILLTHWHLDHIGGVPGVRALISGESMAMCMCVYE